MSVVFKTTFKYEVCIHGSPDTSQTVHAANIWEALKIAEARGGGMWPAQAGETVQLVARSETYGQVVEATATLRKRTT